ncbi:MAG TPA: hypothetical protein VN408_42430 [Actinoplanes sp.]|nr:hypothetical protein [Actinoplanes sp.]
MRIRRAAVALTVFAAVTVPAVATGVVAYAHSSSPAAAGVSSPKGPKKPAKQAVKFTAVGLVTAVDVTGATVTVAAKGGTKDVRGTTVTVAVPSGIRITLNDKRVDLNAVTAGQRITVTGTRAGGVFTAARIQVKGKSASRPSPSPSTEPSESPENDDD